MSLYGLYRDPFELRDIPDKGQWSSDSSADSVQTLLLTNKLVRTLAARHDSTRPQRGRSVPARVSAACTAYGARLAAGPEAELRRDRLSIRFRFRTRKHCPCLIDRQRMSSRRARAVYRPKGARGGSRERPIQPVSAARAASGGGREAARGGRARPSAEPFTDNDHRDDAFNVICHRFYLG